MKVISFATLKGGTGKSMITFNVAGALAERGKKVLCIDGDPQANLSSKLCQSNQEGTLMDVFEFEDVKPSSVIKGTHIENIDAICTNINMTQTEFKLVTIPGRELILENFIEDNKSFFEANYDYILIDTNPSFSVINQNVFLASDGIILVNDPSLDSLNGSKTFIQLWGQVLKRLRRPDNIKGFLINQYMKRRNIFEEFVDHCSQDEIIGKLLFKSLIPHTVKFAEANMENKTINIYDKKSDASIMLSEFVDELIERV